jgi:hypothetical protein
MAGAFAAPPALSGPLSAAVVKISANNVTAATSSVTHQAALD